MNEDNANNLKDQHLEQQHLKDQHLKEQHWAALLSETAQRTPADSTVIPVVLKALHGERAGEDSLWARYLSSAAQLQRGDLDAVRPVLLAVRLERRRVRQWRESVTRLMASAAAVAAVVVAVAVFSPPLNADPREAYSAYQEAAQGW